MQSITSRNNLKLREAARLIASARERRKQSRCVLEGDHLITMYESRYGAPEIILVNEDALARDAIRDAAMRHPSKAFVVPAQLFGELAVLPADVGILAVVPTPQSSSASKADFCLLLEDVQDPGNVGSVLRSAAAAGVEQVLLSKHCAFAWSPKVLRAGQGAHFLLDLHQDVDLCVWAARYREQGDVVAAVVSSGDNLFSMDIGARVAIIVGNEGAGVSEALLAQTTKRVTIPMPGAMQSLNVAAAAAVILFECVRRQLNASRCAHA